MTRKGAARVEGSRAAAGGIASAAALVTVVTTVSRLAGFGREAVIAAVYGATAELDAYLVATGVPNVVIALLSTAVVTALVPVVSARVRGQDPAGGHRLFRTATATVTAVLGLASLLMALAAPVLVRLMAPGFSPPQLALAVDLTRILLLATVLVAAMNLVSGLLQVHRRFFWPAFVGIPFNAVMITAAVAFGARFGVEALAWGFVLGSLLRVAVQLPSLRATGFRWRAPLRWRDEGVTAVAALLPVVVLGHVTANVNTFVDRIVGSLLEPGAISALNYAYRLVSLPHGLLVTALLAVLYPMLGARGDAPDRGEFADLVTRGMGVLSCLLVPVAAGLVILAEPVITVVYARGSFGAQDAARTAAAMTAYAPGLVALGVRDVGMRALYGLRDSRWPAAAAVVGMLVNIVGDVSLGPRYGVTGLAAATTLSFATSAAFVVGVLALRHRGVDLPRLLTSLGRSLLAGAAAAGAMAAVAAGVTSLVTGTSGAFVTVASAGGTGMVVFAVALRLMKAPELTELAPLWDRMRRIGRR